MGGKQESQKDGLKDEKQDFRKALLMGFLLARRIE
jgi:hypothetical protein